MHVKDLWAFRKSLPLITSRMYKCIIRHFMLGFTIFLPLSPTLHGFSYAYLIECLHMHMHVPSKKRKHRYACLKILGVVFAIFCPFCLQYVQRPHIYAHCIYVYRRSCAYFVHTWQSCIYILDIWIQFKCYRKTMWNFFLFMDYKCGFFLMFLRKIIILSKQSYIC